ncbi:hypothetical protein D3C76_1865550 [compost metagenome]
MNTVLFIIIRSRSTLGRVMGIVKLEIFSVVIPYKSQAKEISQGISQGRIPLMPKLTLKKLRICFLKN